LYAVAVNGSGNHELFRMAIDPTTGNLGTPTSVTVVTDGMGSTANGYGSRLATDGTCLYDADVGGTDLVFQICGTTVKVWADAGSGGDAPGISTCMIAFGPANQNLFLVEDGTVYSTTGLSGMTPGSFSQVASLPNSGTNEGAAFVSLGSLRRLFASDESYTDVYGATVTGSGGGVAVGTATTYPSAGNSSATTGEQIEFGDVEGLAILNGSPRFADGTSFFRGSSAAVPALGRDGLLAASALLLLLGAVSLRRRRSLWDRSR